MDQNALVLLLTAALMGGKAAPVQTTHTPSGDGFLVEPFAFCRTVSGAKPQLSDVKLDNPSKLSAEDQQTLRSLAGFMRKHHCGVVIEGYTDENGSANRKKRDSETRAKTVATYLTTTLPESERVAAEQVKSEGKGELTAPGLTREQKKIVKIVL
ncbi:OmpA family protein [Methylocystis parvus]|nr:OmpA family protein [Methylocystis parvus]WBJ98587.1 OmpA family protein [Methylocystis parvus OBBP]